MIFDLYAVVRNFAIKVSHNLIGSFFPCFFSLRRKHRKDDSSDPSLSNNSDSSDDSYYRCKRRKNEKHRKKDPIKLCETLTATLLTTGYKSKIIWFKMDEDLLQRRIYFLTFVESLEMIFYSTKKLVKYFYIIQK